MLPAREPGHEERTSRGCGSTPREGNGRTRVVVRRPFRRLRLCRSEDSFRVRYLPDQVAQCEAQWEGHHRRKNEFQQWVQGHVSNRQGSCRDLPLARLLHLQVQQPPVAP